MTMKRIQVFAILLLKAIVPVAVLNATFSDAVQIPQPGMTEINVMTQVQGVNVNRVPLYQRWYDSTTSDVCSDSSNSQVPYCFTACALSQQKLSKNRNNFLATQVWPSSRVASMALEQYLPTLPNIHSVVEFGCGPGLPSITAALSIKNKQQQRSSKDGKTGNCKVFATDIDTFALNLVKAAAHEQDVSEILETYQYDLAACHNNNVDLYETIPHADLYIMSDVFESKQVAIGAAHVTSMILQRNRQHDNKNTLQTQHSSSVSLFKSSVTSKYKATDEIGINSLLSDKQTLLNSSKLLASQQKQAQQLPLIWIFCQSDRSQRDTYINELRHLISETNNEDDDDCSCLDIMWKPYSPEQLTATTISDVVTDSTVNPSSILPWKQRLWLCEIDEMNVKYN